METSDTVVLIDGDIIVYRVGFSCNSGEEWSIAKSRVDRTLQDIIENTDSCMGFGYLTDGKDNFRNKIAKTAPYKGNRIANKPPFYDEIRKYLEEYHGFKMEYTQEADDAIGIQHAELTQWNIKEPIVSPYALSPNAKLVLNEWLLYGVQNGHDKMMEKYHEETQNKDEFKPFLYVIETEWRLGHWESVAPPKTP